MKYYSFITWSIYISIILLGINLEKLTFAMLFSGKINRITRYPFKSPHCCHSYLSSVALKQAIPIVQAPRKTIFQRTTIVQTVDQAYHALSILNANPDKIWACDTEVADIDVKTQSPVGNGKVTCFSVYGGPDVDFGNGPGSILWVENINESDGLIMIFKEWFQSQQYQKVWHNYGFDRHVMFTEGVDCYGFAGK